jgi:HPt (histidine-containing phosphotransfer) domain-containing protein
MTESREHSDKLYDLSSLEELSGGNNDFIRQMILLFLEQAAATIAGMENAIAEKDISQIKFDPSAKTQYRNILRK